MADYKGWSGEERRREDRRKILERRRQARADKKSRRKAERRLEQICYVCHGAFTPTSAGGAVICPSCQLEGARGGKRGPRERPPF